MHHDRREREERSGECLARDLYGRLGELRVNIPLDPQVQKTIHSDPETPEDDSRRELTGAKRSCYADEANSAL